MPLVKDFYRKARYPLDLGAAKPVKRRTKCDWPDRSDLGLCEIRRRRKIRSSQIMLGWIRHINLAAHQMAE